MSYGPAITGDYGEFSNDERLNYALKVSLQRVQTDLKVQWFKEPTDYIPKFPNEIYKNNLPSFGDVLSYVLIDNNIDGNGTEMATNITVNQILQSETHSIYTLSRILDNKFVRNISDYAATNNSDSNFVLKNGKRTQIRLLSRGMYTRYNYWINKLTGRASLTEGGLNTSASNLNTSGTYPHETEPLNAYITNGTNGATDSLNDERVWDTINTLKNNPTENTTIFYNKLIQYSNGISIINPDDIDPDDPHNLSKKHPFLKIYVQVPLYSTKNSFLDTFTTSTTGGNTITDNIGFTNPVLERALGDVNGYPYKIFGYNGTSWTNINTETGGDIFYFLNNPGFLLGYGIKNPRFGKPISQLYPPIISYIRYVGETFTDGLITQSTGLPDASIFNEKDLRIDTSTNTIYRLGLDENNEKAWISIGGGGGAGLGGKWSDADTTGDIYYEAGKVSIGKSTAEYTLDVSGSFNLNNMIFSKNNILDISGTTVIKGDLTVQGNYTIQGDTYVIHTEEVEISNNTLILNSNIEDKPYGGLAESELESGIIIKRAKIDETTFAEPYKIIYKDDRTDPDEHIEVGISGNLHRVATIEIAKKNTNYNQFIKWNGESGQLIPDTDISSSNTHLYVNKKLQTTEDIYTKFSDATFSSVFPHQDNNQDIGLWGILNKMFDQPPKFNEESIVPSTVGFTINWSKSFNTLKFAPTGAEVPFIKNIWIDIWNGTTWASVSKTLLSSVTTFTFNVGTTYGGVTITTSGIYKVRVYGVNDSGSNTYNFLEFDNLGVLQSGKPSEPRSVSFPSSSFDSLTFRYTAPQSFDENIENSTEPPLQNYEIKYIPIQVSGNFNTVRHRGTTDLNTNEITATVTTNLTQASNINTVITNSTTTSIYPDMNYEFISIRAKNTLNANRSSNGVTSSLTRATPTVPITYGTAPIFPTLVSGQTEIQTALRSIITDSSKSFRVSGGSSAINANYFNVPTTTTTFSIGSNNSEIYVNRATDKLGRNISGSTNVATVKIEYSTNGTSFVEDKTLNFNGFEANTYNGTTTIDNDATVNVLTFNSLSNTNSYTGTDPAYNGYGLKGVFKLSAIPSIIGPSSSSAIFKPATNIQSVQYIVNSPSLANQTYTYNFYVDDLNGNPTVNIHTVTAADITTKWCYGIPSVNTFTLNVNYTIGNYASKFLPSDGKYATISTGGIVSTGSEDKTTTSLSENFPKDEAFTSRTLTSDINSITISNAVSVRGFNLNNTTGVLASASLGHESKLFLDTASFSGTSLVSFATSGIFVYNATEPYTLSPLENSSKSNFTLANNQLMFYKGAFYSGGNTEAFGNYSTGYFVVGKNHSTLSGSGDNVGGTIYKWVTKKVLSNVTINDATTRLKTVTIGYNGTNTSNLPANIGNFVVYVLQNFIGGVSQTYTTSTTIWYNGSKAFNSNAFTTSAYSNYDATSNSIGIFENGKVTLDINSSVNCDIYVRVGLPANSTNRITSISMS